MAMSFVGRIERAAKQAYATIAVDCEGGIAIVEKGGV